MKRTSGFVIAVLLLWLAWPGVKAQTVAPTEKSELSSTSPTTYRLVYTITERDGTKELGTQHYALTIDPSTLQFRDATIRLTSAVPIVSSIDPKQDQKVISLANIGLTISAHIREFKTAVEVFSELHRDELSDDLTKQTGNPVIRHAELTNTALLTLGKPLMLGSLDIPGSTRHLDINVVAEIAR